MDDLMLTPADVARRCQISTKTVLRAIHSGRLRAYRLGSRGAFRMRPSDVDHWINGSLLEVQEAARTPVIPRVAEARGTGRGRLVVAPSMGRQRPTSAASP